METLQLALSCSALRLCMTQPSAAGAELDSSDKMERAAVAQTQCLQLVASLLLLAAPGVRADGVCARREQGRAARGLQLAF